MNQPGGVQQKERVVVIPLIIDHLEDFAWLVHVVEKCKLRVVPVKAERGEKNHGRRRPSEENSAEGDGCGHKHVSGGPQTDAAFLIYV